MGTHTSRGRDQINNRIVPEDTPQMLHQTFPPISRLPTEILAGIFEHAIALGQTRFFSHDVQLRRLVRVCLHWHAVAMEYPCLWSSLVFTSVKATALMLQRSKESPLVVKADFSHKPWWKPLVKRAVLLALSNTSRIRVMHIKGSRDFLKRLVAEVMHQRAPLLESFCLTSWGGSGPEVMTLPPSLFADTTPRLRHFSVSRLSNWWCLPLLCNLTHLEVCDSNPVPLVEFHDVLTRCPALNTLIVTNALPAASDQLLPPVFLPLLSYLKLAGGLAGCEVVMHNISFPRTTAITLDLAPTPLPLPLHFLTDLRDRVSTIGRLSLQIKPILIIVQAWTAEPVAVGGPPLDLHFRGLFNFPHFNAICEGFALTQLVNLEVEVSWLGLWESEAVLNALQNVKVLTVRHQDVGVPISILNPMHGQAVPLPGLRELTVCGVNTGLHAIPDLQACLMLRRGNCADIETLKLYHWAHIRKVNVDMLGEALGVTVRWDGIEWG